MASKSYPLFGANATFSLEAEGFVADQLLDDAYRFALRLQKVFNLYDPASELSTLNRKRRIEASPELLAVLDQALRLAEASEGAYDPSLGKQFLQRKRKEVLMPVHCSYKDIRIAGKTISLLHEDVWVDLGSVAKGHIAERVAKFLVENGVESGYVDARGDVRVFGEEQEIDVQHPREDGVLCTIRVKDKGIATSGDYRQYDTTTERSHILNQQEIVSATVVADSLEDADAYATLLMVCEPALRKRLIMQSGFPALTVDKGLNTRYYNRFEELIVL